MSIAQLIADTAGSDILSAKLDENDQVRSEMASDSVDVRYSGSWYRVQTDRQNADELFMALIGEGSFVDFSRSYAVLNETTLKPQGGMIMTITRLAPGEEIDEQLA